VRVIVTRPLAQALQWTQQFDASGQDAVALPLMTIAAVDDPSELVAAWHALSQRRLVVFVSPNAAEQFFAHRPEGVYWPAGVLAGSPGPGTSRTLRNLGVPVNEVIEPALSAPQFDSEALWEQLRVIAWPDQRVLIVRGESGRNWLADTLQLHGAQVEQMAAYQRTTPRFEAQHIAILQQAQERPQDHVWFFSSSEAITNLTTAAVAAQIDWSSAQALCTHPRIGQRAQQAGFGRIVETQPTFGAVVACLHSLR
jgi:uroporphyrinogen-III synthase